MRVAAAALLLIAIAAIGTKLALAPYHDVYTPEECRAAYARARTHMDTVSIDFKPVRGGRAVVNARCSSARTTREVSSSDFVRR